jgi:hypothetical protein
MGGRAAKVMTLAAAAFAAVAALGLSTAAASRTVRIASHITIHSNNLTFSGRVKSRNAACVNDRKVTLYRTNGDVLGHTHTNSHGHWKITASGSAGISLGRFFAKVKRESQGAAGTIYVCKGAKSKTIRLHH